jgi:hypothetical protein
MPKELRSQHSVPTKQLSGISVQPCTKQPWVTNVSQYVASVPAQSASAVQGVPQPVGGFKHVPVSVSQAYPPSQSAALVQPELVQ